MATVNGRPDQRLTLDPTADLPCLSERFAASVGLKPDASAISASVRVADGRTLVGRLATLPSVQIGPFTAEKVTCLVVPGDVTPILPGGGTLGPIVTRLDDATQPPSLALTRVDLAPIMPRVLPPGAPQPKTKR